mmetsp:Transcript_36452/g.114264  ORF Transcript_36452/g.114264 Transcript_36452/m.114264 type:complete len:216 (-) Transcript_36452:135-782(-)
MDTIKMPAAAATIGVDMDAPDDANKFGPKPLYLMANDSVHDIVVEAEAPTSQRVNPQLKDVPRSVTASKAALLQQEARSWENRRNKLSCCARMSSQLLVCVFFLLMIVPEEVADLALKMLLPVAVGSLLLLEVPTLAELGPMLRIVVEVLIVVGFFGAMVAFVAIVENSAYTVVRRVRGVQVDNAAAERTAQYSSAKRAPETKEDVDVAGEGARP